MQLRTQKSTSQVNRFKSYVFFPFFELIMQIYANWQAVGDSIST